jgi:hypothetical protein
MYHCYNLRGSLSVCRWMSEASDGNEDTSLKHGINEADEEN